LADRRCGKEGGPNAAPGTAFAFFEFPDAKIPDYKAATLPTTGRAFDHVCFTVQSMEQFNAWSERRTAAGVDNLSPIQEMGPDSHAYFFSDPNGIVLEVIAPNPMMRFPVLEDPDPVYYLRTFLRWDDWEPRSAS